MFERLRAAFAGDKPTDQSLATGDSLYADGLGFTSKDFPRYNPEALTSWKGHQIFDKMMRDEQVKAVVEFRRKSVTGRDWFFSFDDAVRETLGDDEAQRRIDLFNFIVSSLPGSFTEKLDGVLSSIEHGYSITEKTFGLVEWDGQMWWCIKRLAKKPFWTFEFRTDEFGNLEGIVQKVNGREIDVDPSKVIHYVQHPEHDEQFGLSELEAAYRSWFAKDIIIKLQSIYLERYAGGFLIAKPTGGTSLRAGTAEYTQLLNVLTNLQTKSAIVLPKSLDIEHHQPGSTTAFENAIAQHDKSIAKALLVPNLLGISEQGSTGSFAQSQTQLEAFLWILDSEAARLEEALNEQLFRDLGDANFGDGLYPRFTFRGISQALAKQVVDMWNSLVASGAVQSSETDEEYVRDLMGFPQKPESEEGAEAVNQSSALNGAQVASLTGVLSAVAEGTIPKSTAIEVITAAFPISLDKATRMVEDIEDKEEPEPMPALPAPDGQEPAAPPTDDEPFVDPSAEDDETIIGADKLKAGCEHAHAHVEPTKAFTAALRRVDFTAIDNNATTLEWETTDRLGAAMDNAVLGLINEIEERELFGADTDPNDINKLRLTPAAMGGIKKALRSGMSNSWSLGQQHANREMRKAKFARRKGQFATLEDKAASFLNSRSVGSAAKLGDDAVAIVKNVLMNSIKFSWTQAQTVEKIYDGLVTAGLISQALAEQELGALLGTRNAQARLNTTVRTTSFEAINEARFAFFNDPALNGFVQSLEYSAILDSRVTSICRALGSGADGGPHIHPSDSSFWDKYRPPNHFNCRSLLIALTDADIFDDTTDEVVDPNSGERVEPQSGFG